MSLFFQEVDEFVALVVGTIVSILSTLYAIVLLLLALSFKTILPA